MDWNKLFSFGGSFRFSFAVLGGMLNCWAMRGVVGGSFQSFLFLARKNAKFLLARGTPRALKPWKLHLQKNNTTSFTRYLQFLIFWSPEAILRLFFFWWVSLTPAEEEHFSPYRGQHLIREKDDVSYIHNAAPPEHARVWRNLTVAGHRSCPSNHEEYVICYFFFSSPKVPS